ncbi:MAG: hypothetical protein K8L91_32805 [Anaerolineae bacterium]|nr:hypothetical protein [Anaerolineae bacterium]
MRLLNLLSLIFSMLLLVSSIALFIARRQPAPTWIGFSDSDLQMYIYDINRRELHSMGNGVNPLWSPKGDFVIYDDGQSPRQLRISKYPYSSSEAIRLPNFPYTQAYPRISPDGAWISFNAWANSSAYGLFYMPADGTKIYSLANWSGEMAFWSPNSRELAFIYNGALYTIPIGKGTPVDVSNPPSFGQIPLPKDAREIVKITDMLVGSFAWSHDGGWLYFILKPSPYSYRSDGQLYRVKRDGSNLSKLTDDTLYPIVFRLSPNDNLIAFSTFDGCYIMRSDGSQLKQMNVQEISAVPISWSSDGEWIVLKDGDFESVASGGIYRITPDGSQFERLTDDNNHIWGDVELSSDGQWIAYGSNFGTELYQIRLDGSEKRLLANVQSEIIFINWSPPIDKSWDYLILVGMGAVLAGVGLSSQRLINKRGI